MVAGYARSPPSRHGGAWVENIIRIPTYRTACYSKILPNQTIANSRIF
jgi:hypothetical protein